MQICVPLFSMWDRRSSRCTVYLTHKTLNPMTAQFAQEPLMRTFVKSFLKVQLNITIIHVHKLYKFSETGLSFAKDSLIILQQDLSFCILDNITLIMLSTNLPGTAIKLTGLQNKLCSWALTHIRKKSVHPKNISPLSMYAIAVITGLCSLGNYLNQFGRGFWPSS